MSTEMQYLDVPTAVVNTLYGYWLNANMEVWDNTEAAWIAQDAANATILRCCVSPMTRIGSTRSLVGTVPSGLVAADPGLLSSYTIVYIDTASATSTAISGIVPVGTQDWEPTTQAAATAALGAAISGYSPAASTGSVAGLVHDGLDTNVGSRMATFTYTAPDNTSIGTAATQATAAAGSAATAASQTTTANIAAAVWEYLLTTADALAAAKIGKWFRTILVAINAKSTVINVTPAYIGQSAGGTPTAILPEAWENSAYSVTFPLIDAAGAAIDVSAVPLTLDLWDPNASPPATAIAAATTGTTNATLSVGGTEGNMITLAMNPTATATPANYVWLLRPTANTAPPYTSGKLTIKPAPPIAVPAP